ncbi:MAG: hypothetical protein RLZ98_679 [Pseudomonadota bacterium]|jgi:MFS family permease
MEKESTAAPGEARMGWSLLVLLLLQSAMLQLGMQLARVNTTYAAIEIKLPVVWIGVITASYALFPAIAAMQIGRFSDRRGDTVALMVGTALSFIGCAGLWLLPTAIWPLIVFNTLLGLGQTFCMTGQQSFSGRRAGPAQRDSVFGYYMLSLSLGQALGPIVLSVLSKGADLPPVKDVFFFTAVFSIVSVAISFMLYRRAGSGRSEHAHEPMPLGELVKVKGLVAMAMASALVVTAMDLTIVYLPLIGTERGIDASMIGYMLTMRGFGSILARASYSSLVRVLGRIRLMYLVMLGAMLALLVVALPVPVWLLFLAVSSSGFFLGIAITASLTTLVDIAPDDARGAALAIRQTCNRLGQFFTPMVVSLVAALTGAGGIFVVTALAVGISGAVAERSLRQRRDPARAA